MFFVRRGLMRLVLLAAPLPTAQGRHTILGNTERGSNWPPHEATFFWKYMCGQASWEAHGLAHELDKGLSLPLRISILRSLRILNQTKPFWAALIADKNK